MSENKTKKFEIATVVKDLELMGKVETFNALLDHDPKPDWIQKHPFHKKEIVNEMGQKVKVPVEYIPIEVYERLLRKLFQQYDIEVRDTKAIFNAVSVTIRVNYLHPVTNEWRYVDGVGAVDVQTEKGKPASSFEHINSNAVMKALPAAKSYAIKDALQNLGELFGASLNRRDLTDEIKSPYNLNDKDL